MKLKSKINKSNKEDRLKLYEALESARKILRKYVPENVRLSEELIREKKRK